MTATIYFRNDDVKPNEIPVYTNTIDVSYAIDRRHISSIYRRLFTNCTEESQEGDETPALPNHDCLFETLKIICRAVK